MTEIEKKEDYTYYNEKLVFDSVYGELEFYKKKSDVLERDLFKSQTQNKKLELSLKKSQDINALYGKNVNNTSISFLLPSEFKTLWENFSKDMILEAFDLFYDDYYNLCHVSQDVMLIIYEETKNYMRQKVDQVLNTLNINLDLNDKANSSQSEKFLLRFKSIFQEYFTSIFMFTEEFNTKIKERLLEQVKEYLSRDLTENLHCEMKKQPFKFMVENFFKLTIYMLLHDPVLNLGISFYKDRKLIYNFYNKNTLLNIEGFGTDNTPCVVVIHSPLIRKDCVYMGIKPAVYCIPKDKVNQDITNQCEKNKKILRHKNSSSIGELSHISSSLHDDNKVALTPNKNKSHTPMKSTSSKYQKNEAKQEEMNKYYDRPLAVKSQTQNNLSNSNKASFISQDLDRNSPSKNNKRNNSRCSSISESFDYLEAKNYSNNANVIINNYKYTKSSRVYTKATLDPDNNSKDHIIPNNRNMIPVKYNNNQNVSSANRNIGFELARNKNNKADKNAINPSKTAKLMYPLKETKTESLLKSKGEPRTVDTFKDEMNFIEAITPTNHKEFTFTNISRQKYISTEKGNFTPSLASRLTPKENKISDRIQLINDKINKNSHKPKRIGDYNKEDDNFFNYDNSNLDNKYNGLKRDTFTSGLSKADKMNFDNFTKPKNKMLKFSDTNNPKYTNSLSFKFTEKR